MAGSNVKSVLFSLFFFGADKREEDFNTIAVENIVFELFREFLTSLRNSFFEPLIAD